MNQKIEKNQKIHNKTFDLMKWISVALLISATVIGNHFFSDFSLLYRVLVISFVSIVIFFISINTRIGREFLDLLISSKKELIKVVWPTKQETTQTTLIVLVVVTIMALILWALDSLFAYLVSLFVN